VKFSCERCGKKYATADPPSPGKVYKLKCKACGHLIVVRAAAAPAPSLEIPDLPLLSGTPEPVAPSRNGASAGAPQMPGDATSQVAIEPAGLAEEEVRPPHGDPGYVDLFSDLTPAHGAEVAPADPFFAAARASLPEAYGRAGGAPDPFAPLARERAGARSGQPPSSIPQIPVIPKLPPHKNGLPIALIGGGVAVLVGILAFVLLGLGKKPAPPPRAVRAEAPLLLPTPQPPLQPEPLQPPPPEPVQAQGPAPSPPLEAQPPPPVPKPGGEERRREERRRRSRDEAQAARDAQERERRAQAERDARERDRKERERLAAAAAAQRESEGLTQAQIESVLRSTRKAFDGCLASARGTESRLDGRRVLLRLNIQPSGTVTYPTLDDVTLSGTDLGSCLKSAARLMVFPKFRGDTLHVEVPLVMR
jgi:DNA-directed RNA polymerase subunit RPC12/RpoP